MKAPLPPSGLLPDGFRSVADQLAANVAASPDKPALVCVDDGRSLTWAELGGWAARVGQLLNAMGIGANDRVAVLGDNSLENLILYYGIQAHGATYCTVNVEVNRHHLQEMLDRIAPKVVFRQEDLAELDLGSPGTWISYGPLDGTGPGLFAMLESMPDGPAPRPETDPEDGAVISFTSGTSAAPKGVLHSFCNYFAIAQHQLDRWGLTADDRVLEFRSFSWASAHMLSLNPVLLAGATLLFAREFSRSRFAGWLAEYRPSVVIAVPTVVNMLLERRLENADAAFDSVRFVSCSTAPLMPDQHRRFEDTYGVTLVQLYGMSEGGVVCANRPESRRIGSVGKPGMYQDVRIKGPDGTALPAGETGDIVTVSAQHAHAYLHRGGEIEPIRGGELPTGDIGYFDADGFVHVTGRARDVIIRGGVNIAPLEIDAVLAEHPDVAEAASFGIPDPVFGERVAACVVARPGAALSAADIEAHCAARLPEAKRPTPVEIVAALPKNARGKIDRNALRDAWQATSPAEGKR